jgi:hypothetical protein
MVPALAQAAWTGQMDALIRDNSDIEAIYQL